MRAYPPTIFLSAFLLFQVELIIGKELLPWFGGSPSVWTTCLVFFQLVLLFSYLYAHIVVNRLRTQAQIAVHLALLSASLIVMAVLALHWPSPISPDASWKPAGGSEPTGALLALLGASVGFPFFVLSTTTPLLQAWYTSLNPGKSAYRLYALSNVGSLLALLSYPFLIEPYLPIHVQTTIWSAAFLIFTIGVLRCALPVNALSHGEARPDLESDSQAPVRKPRTVERSLWTALSAATSALLLSTTNHMCQDTAVIPLLWVLPLALYLASFILCFESDRLYRRWLFPPLFCASLVLAVVVLFIGLNASLPLQIGADAAVLFTGCMVCHGELARAKPAGRYLTGFYLAVAFGGALGGLSVAIVAPRVFTGFWEFHISLFAAGAMFLLALARDRASFFYWNMRWTRPPLLAGLLGLGIALIVQALGHTTGTRFATRNFYGLLRVVEYSQDSTLTLVHGRISHGFQYEDSARARVPTSYYSLESGLGLAIENYPRRQEGLRIGVVGLGVGTIAAYARAQDTVQFYEINPAVPALSQGPRPLFSYLKNCPGKVEITLGDARLSLEEELRQGRPGRFDILALDAFTSDAIPVHLLTSEAFAIYLCHLRSPESLVAVHISNRYLDLVPVVYGFARERGLFSILINADEDDAGGWNSDWILLSRSNSVLALDSLQQAATSWDSVTVKKIRLWSDDYSNLFSVLK